MVNLCSLAPRLGTTAEEVPKFIIAEFGNFSNTSYLGSNQIKNKCQTRLFLYDEAVAKLYFSRLSNSRNGKIIVKKLSKLRNIIHF